MLGRTTHQLQRDFFLFVGMPALILYAVPITRQFLSTFLEYEIVSGLNIITAIALFMGYLSYQIKERKL